MPDGKAVLAELQPIIAPVYAAMDAAALRACEFFDSRKTPDGGKAPVDPFLHPALVRYFGKELLRNRGQQVTDEEQDSDETQEAAEFQSHEIPNNGLSLTYSKYDIRILKAVQDDKGARLPIPGHSNRRQAFYAQQLRMLSEDTPLTEPIQLNLVLLWTVDERHRLADLILVCPKSGALSRASVTAHWYEPVPHPVHQIASAPGGGPVEDLPITLPSQVAAAATARA